MINVKKETYLLGKVEKIIMEDYGNGKIIVLKYVKGKNLVMVNFYDHSIKEFILEYTDLEIVT